MADQQNTSAPVDLTDQERIFIDEYFLCGFNQSEAARKAGYSVKSARVQGHRLITRDNIRKEIERRFAEHAMTANEAIARLASIARGDSNDLLDADGDVSIRKLRERGKTHLVKKIKRTKRTYPSKGDEEPYTEERIEVELYDAQAALNTILKELHLKAGEATDRHEVEFTDAKERLAHLLARRASASGATGDNQQSDG